MTPLTRNATLGSDYAPDHDAPNGRGTRDDDDDDVRRARHVTMTHQLLGIVVSSSAILSAIVGAIVAAGIGISNARAQIATATPRSRTDSIVGVLARHDTVISSIKLSIDGLHKDLMGFNCQRANYPSPFCDSIQRVPGFSTRGAP